MRLNPEAYQVDATIRIDGGAEVGSPLKLDSHEPNRE
jgi:hypothetical protein